MKRLSLLVLLFPALASATTYEVDPAHTTVQFVVTHMMVTKVRGTCEKVSGTLNVDEKDPTKSTVEVSIDPVSINTRVQMRDNDLRSPNFFEVAKFPAITFKSKKVAKGAKGALKVTGDLTIRDVTREVTLDVGPFTKEWKDPYGNLKIGAFASTKVNRLDWGLKWNVPLEAGGVLVGNDVDITIDLEAKKLAEAAPAPPAATK